MKYFLNIFGMFLLLLFSFSTTIKAEIEPNNTYQQANQTGPNSTDSGAMNEPTQTQTADSDDWWKVTLPSDGSLYAEVNTTNGLDVDLYIYDINGTNSIVSASRYGSKETIYHPSLKTGTYFIRVYRYSGTGTYSILTRSTSTPYANDSEPNDTYQTAQTLNVNSSSSGHIRFYQDSSTDYDDWWKVTIPYDGSLEIKTESDSAEIDLYIYDVNGTNSLVSASTYGLSETIKHTNLMPGIYFIRVYGYSEHGSYTITSTYTQTSLNGVTTNDSEKNDDYLTAINWITFNAAGSTESYAHLGYFTNNYTDYDDWWTITTTTDGKLDIKTESSSTLDLELYIYDVNGTTSLTSGSRYGVNEQATFNNHAAGKYYVRAYRYSGYGSYKITAEFTTPSMVNDTEINDEAASARSIGTDTRTTGHLGYYTNNYTDYQDYYVFTLSSAWDTLYVRTDSDASLDLELYLYNSPSTSVASASSYGANEILRYVNAPAGTYYIRAYRYSGQGSYAMMLTNHYPHSPLTDVKKEDTEIIPTAYSLSQNYPNPFNPATTIKYDIPQTSNVSLKVYDVLGNEVVTLVNENQAAGSYLVNFVAQNLSSGIYFYRIEAGSFTQVKKFILMK